MPAAFAFLAFLLTALVLTGASLLFFAAYRVLFLFLLAPTPASAAVLAVLHNGARLDAALLAFEGALAGGIAVLWGRANLRSLVRLGIAATLLHALVVAVNLACFVERNQHFGELFFEYVTQPYQMALAVLPFFEGHPLLTALALAASVGFVVLGLRLSRRLNATPFSLRTFPRAAAATALSGALLLAAVDAIAVKRTNRPSGSRLVFTHSKYYMNLDSFLLNQAVPNPIYDLFRIYLPLALRPDPPSQLPPEEALAGCRSLLGVTGDDAAFPLRQRIPPRPDLGIRDVVLVQVESLSASILSKEVDGQPVVPFLRRLAQEGLDFPRTYPSFNATAGSVFSAATSFPKSCFDERNHRFASFEWNGCYATLPRVLAGRGYRHFFFEGFAQSADDFVALMRNQGYEAYGWPELKERLARKGHLAADTDALGVRDASFFAESAEILANCPGPFTAHLMTATSHSPWQLPPSFPPRFNDPVLDMFAYVDASIEAFTASLQRRPGGPGSLLLVVTGDHAGPVYSDDDLERIRVPLIFYHPQLAALRDELKDARFLPASHLDIVPTILSLLGGDLPFSGMGRDLLAAQARGVLGGGTGEAFYLKEGWLLRHNPSDGRFRLDAVTGDGRVAPGNPTDKPADVTERLRWEYLALTETAKRLAIERKVFPP